MATPGQVPVKVATGDTVGAGLRHGPSLTGAADALESSRLQGAPAGGSTTRRSPPLLRLIALGHTNAEIASQLFLSIHGLVES